MSKHHLRLDTLRARLGATEVNEHVQGAASMSELTSGQNDFEFPVLLAARDAALAALGPQSSAAARGKASFLASTYRDARYASGGRRYLQTLAYGNTIRGHYEASKHAKTGGIT